MVVVVCFGLEFPRDVCNSQILTAKSALVPQGGMTMDFNSAMARGTMVGFMVGPPLPGADSKQPSL